MMFIVYSFLVACSIFAALFLLIVTFGFKNTKRPHLKTPAQFDIPFQEVRFPTKNNRQLYGWWIPSENKSKTSSPTLILVHGWGRNVERVLLYIQELHPKGFNLLAFDSRNHGSSDKDRFSSMLKFAEDIRSAVDFVVRKSSVASGSIGIIGLSIGGAAAIYAAAHDPRIRCVVTVGAFASPADILRTAFRKWRLPYFLLGWLVFKYVEWRIGATFEQIAPVNNIQNTSAKILLIHGEQDVVVPVGQGRKLASTANPRTTRLWVQAGKGHSDCHLHPEFWSTVETFLQETFEMAKAF